MEQAPKHADPTDPDLAAALRRLVLRISRDAYELRERQGWSQRAEAQAAGLHEETIQRLERGDCDPHLSTLVSLFYIHGYEIQIGLRPTRQPRQ